METLLDRLEEYVNTVVVVLALTVVGVLAVQSVRVALHTHDLVSKVKAMEAVHDN
jgi:hypothetical protein